MGNCFGLIKPKVDTIVVYTELLHREIALLRIELMNMCTDENKKLTTLSTTKLSRLGLPPLPSHLRKEGTRQRRWSYCPGGERMDNV